MPQAEEETLEGIVACPLCGQPMTETWTSGGSKGQLRAVCWPCWSAVYSEMILERIAQDPDRARGARARIDQITSNDPVLSVRRPLTLPDPNGADKAAVLAFLETNPSCTTSEIDSGLNFSKGTAGRLLAILAIEGKTFEQPGDGVSRSRRARLWSVAR